MTDNFAIKSSIQQLPKLCPQKLSEFSHDLNIFFMHIFYLVRFFINVSFDDKILKSTKVPSVLEKYLFVQPEELAPLKSSIGNRQAEKELVLSLVQLII